MSEQVTYRSGITIRTILGIVYATLVMTPVIIYLYLVAGLTDIARFIPVFITLLLFTEVAKFTGKHITPQEAYIIYFMAEIVAYEALFFLGFLQVLYYRQSPYTIFFGIAEKIPTWAAPPLDSPAVIHRTFFARDWLVPFAIGLLGYLASLLIDVAMSFVLIQLYIEVEKLPYPIAPIDAKAILVLTERRPEKMIIFSLAGIAGFLYTFFLYGFPMLTEAFMGVRIQFLPYPWVDLTRYLERVLPGAMFGIATDISTFVVGWVIPWRSAVWILIASFLIFIFGNHIALKLPIEYCARWQREWSQGMPLYWIWQRSMFDLWASPLIGISVGAMLYLFVARIQYLRRALSSLRRLTEAARRRGYLPLSIVVAMYVAGAALGFAIATILVPSLWFVWLLLWGILPFIQSLFIGRAIAEVGLGVIIPYTREAFLTFFAPAGDPWPWLVPVKVTFGAGIISHRIKVAQLVGAHPLDYYKAMAFTIPLVLFFSFLFWHIFWHMAPMPSSFYPWTVIQWPLVALNFSVWVSRAAVVFKPAVIGLFAAILFAVSGIAEKLGFPFSPIGFVIGCSTAPPFALNYFLGALFGKIMERRLGKERWEDYKTTIIAGLFAGIGVALGVSVALTVIGKSIWMKPY